MGKEGHREGQGLHEGMKKAVGRPIAFFILPNQKKTDSLFSFISLEAVKGMRVV